ncbi:MAG: hydroxymethylbilane synthase [Chlamydiia bacterium]|nr:hydroxymethylbilane synthase [Chlamydiia bacterium]
MCARSSPLSRAQFEEIRDALVKYRHDVVLEPLWTTSPGDLDLTISLRSLGKSDFFTRDLDMMVRDGKARVAIHSAKDLPEPLAEGLMVIAVTRGIDLRDSLVLRRGEALQTLRKGALIATSSERRDRQVLQLRSDLQCVDIRGMIGARLDRLEKGEVDGVVVAEAALIRLKLGDLNRIYLPGETAPMQGRLAIVARIGDEEMKSVFQAVDS